MRRIIVSTFATLDGVIEAPQNWSLQYFDEEAGKIAIEQLFAADALLLGRETYEGFAASWPSRTGDFANKINTMAKYVVSTTLKAPLEWTNSTLIKDDVVDEVSRLKQRPGQDILIYGTGRLTQTLLPHDLIDEHQLWIVPVIWGSGTRIFEGMETTNLELVQTKTLPLGTVILSHKLAQQE